MSNISNVYNQNSVNNTKKGMNVHGQSFFPKKMSKLTQGTSYNDNPIVLKDNSRNYHDSGSMGEVMSLLDSNSVTNNLERNDPTKRPGTNVGKNDYANLSTPKKKNRKNSSNNSLTHVQHQHSPAQSTSSNSLFEPTHDLYYDSVLMYVQGDEETKDGHINSIYNNANHGNYQISSHKKSDDFKVKYKTEMCKYKDLDKNCPFGDSCSFAHSENELKKKVIPKNNYKTKNCIQFFETGYCKYGSRCQFRHKKDSTIAKTSKKKSYKQLVSELVNGYSHESNRLQVFSEITHEEDCKYNETDLNTSVQSNSDSCKCRF